MDGNCAPNTEGWTAKVINVSGATISPRGGHTVVHYHNKMYLFGGAKKDGPLNDIYEVDLNAVNGDTIVTRAVVNASFPSLYEFTSVVNGHKLWIFGGGDKAESKDEMFVVDLGNVEIPIEKVQVENGPTPRTQYGNKCFIELEGINHFSVFGGGSKEDIPVDDRNLYLFDMDTAAWSKVQTNGVPPSARQGHVSISFGQTIYIHGGLTQESFCDDFFKIDLSRLDKRWVQIECDLRPCPRAAHNVASIEDCFYIFGGFDSNGDALNDLWKYDTKRSTWTEIKYSGVEVPARMDFAMCDVPSNGKKILMIHGGFNSDSIFFDDCIQFSMSGNSD